MLCCIGKKENTSGRDNPITLAGCISLETTSEMFAGMSSQSKHSQLHASAFSSEDASSRASFCEDSTNHSCREGQESTSGTQVEEVSFHNLVLILFKILNFTSVLRLSKG